MNKYIESEILELKEKHDNSFTEKIVTFLNTEGGIILIGIDDTGYVVGVDKTDETIRLISDIITTQIEPNPQDEIKIELKLIDKKIVIALNIAKGKHNIYRHTKYKVTTNGCNIKIATPFKETTQEQTKRVYENFSTKKEYLLTKPTNLTNLTFNIIKICLGETEVDIQNKSFENDFSLKTADGKYNLLAELIADKNNIPLIFVKFNGYNKTSISKQIDYGFSCIFAAYQKMKNRLEVENINITDTTVRPREDLFLYDFNCVNEALLNALIHNDWTISSPLISMFQDRLEILSHGGLPNGMTKQDFFAGISNPRNPTLMRIFRSLELIEHTGHGIPTIVEKYGIEAFKITDNYICCTIPFDKNVLSKLNNHNQNLKNYTMITLNKTQKKILMLLTDNPTYTIDKISKLINLTTRSVERALVFLQKNGFIKRIGSKKTGNWQVFKEID